MAHRLIDQIKKHRQQNNGNNTLFSLQNGNLQIVDFGCGSLAMQYATAWATAEALESGDTLNKIRVDAYDPSFSMFQIGNILWEQLKEEIRYDSRLSYLYNAMKKTSCYYNTPDSIQRISCDNSELWLSAVHTLYDDNIEQVKNSLDQLYQSCKPNASIITVHNNPNGRALLSKARPPTLTFKNPILYRYSDYATHLTFTREWRFDLKLTYNINHMFLDGEVTNAFSDALGLVCT